VRQILAVLILCSSMVLAGAAKPTPAPKPSPTPVSVPTATPVPPRALPLVVVFPFDTSTDIKPGTGQNAAQLFTQQMNAGRLSQVCQQRERGLLSIGLYDAAW
jgi:hypothetical protein